MKIREATMNDVSDLGLLMEQLGYPTTVDKFRTRYNAICDNPTYHTLVVELDGKVVEMAGLCGGVL